MRRKSVSTAVTFCAAALLAVATGTACATPPTAPTVKRQPGHPVLVDCFWHPEVRPADFLIACGDGNSRLTSLHWQLWNPSSALASGVNVVNDCKPYCAAGKFHSYPVIVRLEQPQPWKKHPQLQHYTQMSLVYTDARPDGFARVESVPLWN